MNKKTTRFAKFRNEIPHSEYCTPQTVSEISKNYDCMIAGSDQIWNPDFCADINYFLPFEVKKRISYAASIGKSALSENETESILKGLTYLDYISVREMKDAVTLRKLCNRDIKPVADPTLLLSAKSWNDIIGKSRMSKDKDEYDLFYILGYMEKYVPVIEKCLQRHHKVKIISLYLNDVMKKLSKTENVEVVCSAGPIEFLAGIRDASRIYTDSFHATVFSCLFKKQFTVFPKGMMNERVLTLLEIFNLKECFLSIDEALKNEPNVTAYDKPENKSASYIEDSRRWLDYAIQS